MKVSKFNTIATAITDALKASQKLKRIGELIKERPLQFKLSADKIRQLNRTQ